MIIRRLTLFLYSIFILCLCSKHEPVGENQIENNPYSYCDLLKVFELHIIRAEYHHHLPEAYYRK
jgi:hypothetical protein